MRIAICIGQSLPGGVGTSTYILATKLREAGHEADIIVTHFKPGSDYERACNDNWPVKVINIGDRWLRKRLETTLCTLSTYDVVINNHSPETSLVLPALPANAISLSVVRTTDARVIEKIKKEAKYLDALVGISPPVTERLCRAGIETEVRTIPNSIILEATGFPVIEKPLRIIYLGRLGKREKNVLIIPEIAHELNRLGVDFAMSIVGDGPNRASLQAKIESMQLSSDVEMLGGLRRGIAWDVLKKSHFSIVPSIFEGFGLVVAESMAAGVVPICSSIAVFKWLLGDYSNLLTVPTNDPASYATTIYRIANNEKLYSQLQTDLKTRQIKHFSPEIMVDKYLSLIDSLSNRNSGNRHSRTDINDMPLSDYHRRRCSRWWKILQIIRYGLFCK